MLSPLVVCFGVIVVWLLIRIGVRSDNWVEWVGLVLIAGWFWVADFASGRRIIFERQVIIEDDFLGPPKGISISISVDSLLIHFESLAPTYGRVSLKLQGGKTSELVFLCSRKEYLGLIEFWQSCGLQNLIVTEE
jgi:hypothetical protein